MCRYYTMNVCWLRNCLLLPEISAIRASFLYLALTTDVKKQVPQLVKIKSDRLEIVHVNSSQILIIYRWSNSITPRRLDILGSQVQYVQIAISSIT